MAARLLIECLRCATGKVGAVKQSVLNQYSLKSSIGSDLVSGGQLRLVRKRDLDAERYQTHSVREAKRNRTGQRLPEVARFELETGWQWQGTRMNATTGKEGSARCDEFTRKLR